MWYMSISFMTLLVVYDYLLFWHYLCQMTISLLALLVVYEYLLYWHYLWYMTISSFGTTCGI